MRAISHLSTNALAGRRTRTLLLIAAVALASTLVAAVGASLDSLNAGMRADIERTLGTADLRVQHVGEEPFDGALLSVIEADPEVLLAAPQAASAFPVLNPANGNEATAVAIGIDPEAEYALRAPNVTEGRAVRADGEIVLGRDIAQALGVGIGDTIEEAWLAEPVMTVVGLTEPSRIQIVTRPEATVTLRTLELATGEEGLLTKIQIKLAEGADPNAAAERLGALLPERIVVEPTERITTGMRDNIRANTFFFQISSGLAFIAAAFIVLTGLTTNVFERQRELAIYRCLGGSRAQLAGAQISVGAFIGAAGAAVGVPLGVVLAFALTVLFPERLPAGLHVSAGGLGIAALVAIASGVVGALYPAANAARSKPLGAMRSRTRPASKRGVLLCTALGLAGVGTQLALITAAPDGDFAFWSYAYAGLPLMFIGYFLLGVPVVIIVARTVGPVLSKLLRLPPAVLSGSTASTPYRNGFTAGALMLGLAMMTSIWTNGNAILNDWLAKMDFPEAFVRGWLGLSESERERIEALDFVPDNGTVLITDFRVPTDAFGVDSFRTVNTSFIAFEPGRFFDMVSLDFVQGDEAYARRRLEEGGAVMVAKEFVTSNPNYGVGNTFTIEHKGETHEFEIVAAVQSPGLDLVSKYFNVGANRTDAAIHSVFGSRADLKEKFNNDAIDFIMIDLEGDVTDDEAVAAIRELFDNTALVVGSGKRVKEDIFEIANSSMRIMSAVAIAAMLLGVLGVSNIVIAGLDARRFEFGVYRAVGADGTLLARLIAGEILLLCIAAGVLGTALGLQGAYAGQRMWTLLAGIETSFVPPPLPIAAGWLILIAITLGMASPLLRRLARQKPRQLLFATRG
jgi:putative ABC transport system permease protein